MTVADAARRPPGLTLRVTCLVGLIIVILLSVYGLMTQRAIEVHFAELDAEELGVIAHAVSDALSNSAGLTDEAQRVTSLDGAVMGHHGVAYRVYYADGRLLYSRPPNFPAPDMQQSHEIANIQPDTLLHWQAGEAVYRGAFVSIRQTAVRTGTQAVEGQAVDYRVLVALEMSAHRQFIEVYRLTLWSYVALATLVGIAAVWLAVYSGLRPLRRISANIRTISTERMDLRLQPEQVPAELSELAEAFNQMMGRLEEVYVRLSNYSADIAHELRTPLTCLRTQTEVALTQARGADEYREILYSSLEEYAHLAKMIDDMLLLAKTENRLLNPDFSRLDLQQELQDVVEYFDAWADEQGVDLALEGECSFIEGDRELLRHVFANLLTNAIRHTPRGKAVRIVISRSDGHSDGSGVVTFENPGEEIAEEHLVHLFQRFYRVDPSRQRKGKGVGLGLAIVKSIVDLHKGEISVTSDPHRTRFVVRLPRCKTLIQP
jgi:two-component system heavy metal sensor histidine kinase CusS